MADATTSETDTETTTDTTEAETSAPETDWQAEAEKWKSQSRKNEDRAKENARKAKELDELHKASLSDVDRAIAEAKDQGRTEALTQIGSRLVDAEFRVAAAGRAVDVDALLEGVDPSRFLDSEGEPDKEAITAWVDRIAPEQAETTTEPAGPLDSLAGLDLGQGSNRDNVPALNSTALERDLKKALNIQ